MIDKKLELIKDSKLIIFDSDGVIFNSNFIKEKSFYNLCKIINLNISKKKLDQILQNNKGNSRYEILDELTELQKKNIALSSECDNLTSNLKLYSKIVCEELRRCEVSKKLYDLRNRTYSKWILLTAGDEKETIKIYKQRGLYNFFRFGIYGAPLSKQKNLDLLNYKNPNILKSDVLYIGDSFSDIEIARRNNFEIILLTEWSSCRRIKNIKLGNNQMISPTLDALIEEYLSKV